MKIGVICESLKFDKTQDALSKISEIGATGVQFYLDPDVNSASDIDSWRDYLKENHLEIAATCIDFGGYGLTNPTEQTQLLEKIERALVLSKRLGATIATSHIGVIPESDHPRRRLFSDSLHKINEFCADLDLKFAIETGPEPSDILSSFLYELSLPNIGVNFDPANLYMTSAENTKEACENLAPFILHVHAKDGLFFKQVNPEAMYETWGYEGPPMGYESDYCKEVPLGEGGVDFEGMLQVLKRHNYDGFLTIEREVGDDPVADITAAVSFLKQLVN